MVRLYITHYIDHWDRLDNEVKDFAEKKRFVKQKLNIDISDTYKKKNYFRIDRETCKIFYPYSRIIFEFDEHNYMEENSNMHCIIEHNQHALIDVDDLHTISENSFEFIEQLDLIEDDENYHNISNKTTEYSPILANFDFKFTTNDSDIDIFLPYVDMLKHLLTQGRMKIHAGSEWDGDILCPIITEDYFINMIKKVLEKNLIKKDKSSKRNVNLDDVQKDLSALKKQTQPIIYKFLLKHNTIADPLRRWVVGLSRTLTNVIIEHDFMKLIVNYTPYQQPKSNMVCKKSKSK